MSGRPAGPPPEAMQFFELLTAHFKFQFMASGVELGLFTVLGRRPGLTRDELRAELGLQERPIRVLLLGCANLGLVRKEGGRYFNTPLSEMMLRDDTPGSRTDFVRWERLRYRGMAWMLESLKANENVGLKEFPGDGATLYERVAGNPELQPMFHSVMGKVTEDVAAQLAQQFDFSKYRHVLDVGGGAAAVYARALAKRFPQVRITILDLPSVAEAARARIKKEGLEGRVDAVGLDCLNEEFPRGADCVLFSHFLEMWSSDRIRALLAKANRAVDAGGGVLVVTPSSDENETGPWISAHLAAYFQTIATSEGMVYTADEFAQWIREAGFQTVGETRLPMTFFVEGKKP